MNSLENGVHIMYSVHFRMAILFLTYSLKIVYFILIFKDDSLFCIGIHTLLSIVFQLNSIIACFVCVL